MSFLDTKHKKKSFTLTTIVLSALLLLLFYIGLTYMDPPIENGIAINFGTTDFGSGKLQPKEKIKLEPYKKPEVTPVTEEKISQVIPEKTTAKPISSEKVLTQENEASVLIKQQQEAKRKAEIAAEKVKAAERKAAEKRKAEEKIRKEREAKKKKLDALMGGIHKSDGKVTGGEGDDKVAGDKGSAEGNPYATSYYGSTGAGVSGYGLSGRSLLTQGKVAQNCNEEGRVVVKIIVDRNGRVVSAIPGVKGTTNSHPCLLEPAKKTAFKHQWNLDKNAPNQQLGFVVVNFKLGE